MPIEVAPSLKVETIGDLLGGDGTAPAPPVQPIDPPRLPGAPEFPATGIYFGMPEDVYHAIHACSASGLKALSSSATLYWAKSVLNPEPEDDDTKFKVLGRAYHVRICEGQEVFRQRYAVELGKDDFDPDELCVTIEHIRAAIEKAGGAPKGTKKDGLIDQLLDLNPEAQVWDRLVADHALRNEGRVMIPFKEYKRIEIAASMIENDEQLKDAFRGGHPEVALFWHDKATGTPMKAKLDYLKLNHLVDLKSFGNPLGKPVQRAIDMAISNNKYFIPVVVYLEGIVAVKELVRQSKGECVYRWIACDADCDGYAENDSLLPGQREWAWQWAHQPEPDVLFVFQQTGIAPVTRGRIMPKRSTFEITNYAVQGLKRKWRDCALAYGTDTWLDTEPVTMTEDEAMTWAATDFGEIE